MPSQAQWSKLNEYFLQVGAYDDLVSFSSNALRRLSKLVPFDQGRVYLFDDEGQVFDEILLNVSKNTTKEYHEYYSGVDERRYSALRRLRLRHAVAEQKDDGTLERGMAARRREIHVLDWSKEPHNTKFYREYVSRIGLTYSTGISLFDDKGTIRVLMCIDRTRPVNFTSDERALLSLVATHLDNMCRKMFGEPPATIGDTIALMAGGAPLTERERQICTLLMRGESPKAIAEKLRIERVTVYKHMQNVYAKLGVSSSGEMIARLQESAARGRDLLASS